MKNLCCPHGEESEIYRKIVTGTFTISEEIYSGT
jgi:hypothetical protein